MSNFIGYEDYCKFLEKYKNIPIVSIAIKVPGIPSLIIDNDIGFKEIIYHLIKDHNYKRIAFIRGPINHPEANIRFETYKTVLKENNIKFDPNLVVQGDFIELTGIKAINILLDQRKETFDAIVSSNDDMAFGALKALQRRNLFVPGDVAIVGFDDVSRSALCNPPLTTVKQPLYKQGRRSLELLIDLIEGKDVPNEITLPTNAIYRRSCGCFPENLSKISNFKKENYKEPFEQLKKIENKIISELFNIAYIHNNDLDISNLKKILKSFITGIKTNDISFFIRNLEEILRKEMTKNHKLSYWHKIFLKLYSLTIPFFGTNENMQLKIENLIYQARYQLEALLFQRESIRREEDKENILIINSIRRSLMSNFSIQKIANSISKELPKIGIKSCYFCLFEDYRGLTPWSRLISAYNEKEPIEFVSRKGEVRFRTAQLIPKRYLPKNRQYNLIVESVFFRDENIFGYIVFEQPEDVSELQHLTRNIGIALKGGLLLQERQLLLEKLAYSNKELEEFASIVAHDLKQPLSVINASLSFLKETISKNINSESNELIDFSIKSSNRMKKMIEALLHFSRVTTSKIEFTKIKLESILRPVLSDLKILINETSAKITHDPLPTIIGSKTLLIQLFENLMDNAIKFRGQKTPHVHIGVELNNSKWIFSVKDNGIGIDQKYFEKIFLIFQRLHTNKEYKGTGIGLAICKKIIEKHHGKIWVESELGKGSTFYFTIPKDIISL